MFDAAPVSDRIWPVALDRVCFAAAGKRLIDGVSLALEPGGITAMMGPNGAGKSLLLRLIAGLIGPSGGRIRWGAEPRPGQGQVALVFQRPVLLRRSVAANLDHALRIRGEPRAVRPARIGELLALGQLEALADHPARALSGGEQQRLALVRALGLQPKLLLLDEPTASLDPQATAAIEHLVARAALEGMTVLLVSHDSGQARRLADRVLFLHRGCLLEEGPAEAFFAAPRTVEAQAYLAGRLLV
jgi:tungstate transport system ATP-binding protein